MRAVVLGASLLLAACAPQAGPQPAISTDLRLDENRTINADGWTLLRDDEIYRSLGKQNTADYELKLAVIQGDQAESYIFVGCIAATPEIAVVVIHSAQTANLSKGERVVVTVKGDKRPNLTMFDAIDGAIAALVDTRLAVGRNLLAALLDSAKPVAVQIAETPAVHFKPGDEVIKTMFTECRDAAPSLGA